MIGSWFSAFGNDAEKWQKIGFDFFPQNMKEIKNKHPRTTSREVVTK